MEPTTLRKVSIKRIGTLSDWRVILRATKPPFFPIQHQVLNIRTSTFENVTYTLYDAQGKLVMQDILSAEQTPIQVGQLAPGSYLLRLNNQTQNLKTFKLIKQQ